MQQQMLRQWKRWRRIDRWIDRVILVFLLGALAIVLAVITGHIQLFAKGMGGIWDEGGYAGGSDGFNNIFGDEP